jgi:hypothetical protein
MGLLDDAIREHLELKRRAGADPTEVARLEREAFGAQEQEAAGNGNAPEAPQAALADELQPDPGAHIDLSDEPHPDEHVHERAAVGDALVDPEPAAHQPAPQEAPAPLAPEPPAEPAKDTHSPAPVEPPAAAHSPPPEPPPAADRSSVEQPTRQFTAAELDDAQRPRRPDEDESADEDEPHDELEETPDFLQETPEHDRLWFEQKPPRDFDF